MMDSLSALSLGVLAGCMLALVAGGFVKGVTGMGLPLLAAPVLASVIPPPQALALLAGPSLVTSAWQMVATGHFRASVLRVWPLFAGVAIGVSLSARLLVTIDARHLSLLLGTIVVIYASLFFRRLVFDIPPRHERWIGFVTGIASGAIGAVSLFFGPVFMMYLSSLRLSKEPLIAAVSVTNVWCALVFMIALARYDILDGAGLVAATIALVPSLAGLVLGIWLRHRIREAAFRRILAVALLVVGLNLVRLGLT